MKTQESPLVESENAFEIFGNIIERAIDEIPKEYHATKNSWVACFGSAIFVAELAMKDLKSEQGFEIVLRKLSTLKVKVQNLGYQTRKYTSGKRNLEVLLGTRSELIEELRALAKP